MHGSVGDADRGVDLSRVVEHRENGTGFVRFIRTVFVPCLQPASYKSHEPRIIGLMGLQLLM
jgi:hypothetical protein